VADRNAPDQVQRAPRGHVGHKRRRGRHSDDLIEPRPSFPNIPRQPITPRPRLPPWLIVAVIEPVDLRHALGSLPLLRGPFAFDQHAPQNFARGGLGNRIDELQLPNLLVRRDAFGHVRHQLVS
jgi:hypothetical protein